jgi:TetR/AcrR family acrAB operon transcriptional repressor
MRKNIDPAMVAQIIDILSYGVLGMYGIENVDNTARFDDLMEMIAIMLDQFLTPEDGGNSDAGKAVIRQLASTARAQFEQMRQLADEK